MPIYEYICNHCGSQFDALRSFKDADLSIECQQCKSHETHRKLSTFFAHSGGKEISGTSSKSCSGGCGSCGGSCSGCSH